ncbi:MAG TPA: VCBS repeat-containing protein [bacterium]|nr:VCBS repeat-containing protein [bacterium]
MIGMRAPKMVPVMIAGALLCAGSAASDSYTELIVSTSIGTGIVLEQTYHDDVGIESYVYTGDPYYAYPASSRTGFPSWRSYTNTMADLNNDGNMDLIAVNTVRQLNNRWSYNLNSYIYWGGSSNVTALPTLGATDVTVADVDSDGYTDIVFANSTKDVNQPLGQYAWNPNSYVYWGSPSYTYQTKAELPTLNARGCEVADLDGDGRKDIIFANGYDGWDSNFANSYIYWGAGNKTFAAQPGLLPSIGGRDVAVGDIDGDTYLDVVIANESSYWYDWEENSYIYWGDGTRGYTAAARAEVKTTGTWEVGLSDFDDDSCLDIVFSCYRDNSGEATYLNANSFVYFGDDLRDMSRFTELDTTAAKGLDIYDIDGSGYEDIVIAQWGENQPSIIFWADDASGQFARTSTFETFFASDITAGEIDTWIGAIGFVAEGEGEVPEPSTAIIVLLSTLVVWSIRAFRKS